MRKMFKALLPLLLWLYAVAGGAQSPCWFKQLTEEVAASTNQSFKEFIKNDPDGFLAYQKLFNAGKTGLRSEPEALQAYADAARNLELKKLGATDELLASINGYGTGNNVGVLFASYADIMNDLKALTNSMHVHGTKIEGFSTILTGLKGEKNMSQGAHWILKDLIDDTKTFGGKTLKIDYKVKNARGTTPSRVDVFCENCSPKNLMVEYKSGSNSITSKTIREQFIERDLFNAGSLDEIQWRMTHTGMTKEKLVELLQENREAIRQLGESKVRQLLPEDKTITSSNFVDKLIKKFDSGDGYTTIFR